MTDKICGLCFIIICGSADGNVDVMFHYPMGMWTLCFITQWECGCYVSLPDGNVDVMFHYPMENKIFHFII